MTNHTSYRKTAIATLETKPSDKLRPSTPRPKPVNNNSGK